MPRGQESAARAWLSARSPQSILTLVLNTSPTWPGSHVVAVSLIMWPTVPGAFEVAARESETLTQFASSDDTFAMVP